MEPLGDDLLIGAAAIAQFLFGSSKKRRKVYYLRNRLPLFYLGSEIAGRKSTLTQFVADQERATANNAA